MNVEERSRPVPAARFSIKPDPVTFRKLNGIIKTAPAMPYRPEQIAHSHINCICFCREEINFHSILGSAINNATNTGKLPSIAQMVASILVQIISGSAKKSIQKNQPAPKVRLVRIQILAASNVEEMILSI